MSTNHATPITPATRDCARMRPLLPLQAHGLLAPNEAERLRAHVSACARCQTELAAYARLDAALLRTLAAAPATSLPVEEMIARVETRIESTSEFTSTSSLSAPMREAGPRYRRSRPLATWLGAAAALIVVALFARLLLARESISTPPAGARLGLAEPTATVQYAASQFSYGTTIGEMVFAGASATEHDPRVLFARNLRLNLCGTPPVGAVSVTWLTASPTYGLALVEANCGDMRTVALVSLYSRQYGLTCQSWSETTNIDTRPQDASALPSEYAGSIPSWLPLPRQSFMGQQILDGGGTGQASTDWLYADQTYAAGWYDGQAYEPASATQITMGGQAGWVAADGSYTTVTVPLAGGQTFFFSGTASAPQIEQLAAIALAHLDTLLPHADSPTPPAGFGC